MINCDKPLECISYRIDIYLFNLLIPWEYDACMNAQDTITGDGCHCDCANATWKRHKRIWTSDLLVVDRLLNTVH